jgi:hypothetical protein
VRATALFFLISGAYTGVRAGQSTGALLEGASLVAIAIPGLTLAGMMARMMIGPSVMNVGQGYVNLFRRSSLSMAVFLWGASLLLFIAGRNLSGR